MAATLPKPRVSKNSQNTQLSYELPHRIHTAKSYPLRSYNGSTIIIYGQENGVRIVWRGGRNFQAPGESSAAPKKANGEGDAVISLDSDDEGPSAPIFEDNPEFEEEEEELDPSRPYPHILQCLDLYFGTDVLHLAVLSASILKAEGASFQGLESLKQKIVFAASCADNSVRLVTLPLTPPSPLSKSRPDFRSSFTVANAGNGKWGETVVILGGHQKSSDGVSMTVDFSSPLTKGASKSSTPAGPQIIVASHSREVTGLLLLYRIPIISPKSHIEPFQSIYLSSPAKSISFNPALSSPPAGQLVVADSTGACRIYDYKLLIKTTSVDGPLPDLAAEQGTWLLTLYPSFQKQPESPSSPKIGAHSGFSRKTIVDAKWVSNGRAILVLLQDGEWGIWDIEGVGPGASQGLLGRQGIKGGSLSQFSLTGFIEGASKPRAAQQQAGGSKFAPMTPGTRKTVDLFGSRGTTGPMQGQISVVEVPSTSVTRPADESIVLWLGESFAVISNLSKYWAANSRKSSDGSGNLFNGTLGGRMIKLENIDLQGERCSGIEQIAHLSTANSMSSAVLSSDVLILGEHRLVVLSAGRLAPVARSENRLALVETTANNGELDVVGIERALARMENRDSNGFLGKRKLLK